MHNPQDRETVSITSDIRFWSNGTISDSAYRQIKKHQADKNKQLEDAMLEEWIV